jgi:minor histocompatibility antigen H13
LIENGFNAEKYALLGLGDIVIPGIFIALLLRFDMTTKGKSKFYFYASFLAYILGLGTTIFVMHVFKHAQVKKLKFKNIFPTVNNYQRPVTKEQ